MRCLYEVLDVESTAEASAIKKQYRKLALQWHPGMHKFILHKARVPRSQFVRLPTAAGHSLTTCAQGLGSCSEATVVSCIAAKSTQCAMQTKMPMTRTHRNAFKRFRMHGRCCQTRRCAPVPVTSLVPINAVLMQRPSPGASLVRLPSQPDPHFWLKASGRGRR